MKYHTDKMREMISFSATCTLILGTSLAATSSDTRGQDYAIAWHTIDGGGLGVSDPSTGGGYTLSGTIGQSDACSHPEPMSGGDYKFTGGFWVIPECPAIPADYDSDCDVDHADYQSWESCASGPEVPYAGDCGDTDFDADLDTDQADFSVFQRCYSGENVPGDPDCTD
jgi:hypothetical protein